jgi:hypothetical protein
MATLAQIPKDRFKIQLVGGMHYVPKHLEPAKKALAEFKPHLIVPENMGMREDMRAKNNRMSYLIMNEARKSPGEKARILQELRKGDSNIRNIDFLIAQQEMMINGCEGCRPYGYTLEGYGPAELETIRNAREKIISTIERAVFLIGDNRVDDAFFALVENERHVARRFMRLRNQRTADNFAELGAVIPAMYPEIAAQEEIRVMLIYGFSHASIVEMLRERGFDAEKSPHSPICLPDPQAKLSMNPDAELGRDEIFRGLFNNIHMMIRVDYLGRLAEHEMAQEMENALIFMGGLDGALYAIGESARNAFGDFYNFCVDMQKKFR